MLGLYRLSNFVINNTPDNGAPQVLFTFDRKRFVRAVVSPLDEQTGAPSQKLHPMLEIVSNR